MKMKAVLQPCSVVIGIVFFASGVGSFAATSPASHDYPLQPVPFTAVHLNDDFWAPRLETNRLTTIPVSMNVLRADSLLCSP
jgi:hypothetical protein